MFKKLTATMIMIIAICVMSVNTYADPAPDNPDAFIPLHPTLAYIGWNETELFTTPYSLDQVVKIRLNRGTAIRLVGKQGRFYKIEVLYKKENGHVDMGMISKLSGWVFKSKVHWNYITRENDEKVESAGREYIAFAPMVAYVGVNLANLRVEPTTDSQIITVLERGHKVRILGKDDDWYKIEVMVKNLDGNHGDINYIVEGYIFSDLIDFELDN